MAVFSSGRQMSLKATQLWADHQLHVDSVAVIKTYTTCMHKPPTGCLTRLVSLTPMAPILALLAERRGFLGQVGLNPSEA